MAGDTSTRERQASGNRCNACYRQRISLVGANGAGKTTLVKLLCRFYDPGEGEILFDGSDLRTLDPEEYQSRLGVVFQDWGRYQLPLRDNTGVGEVSAMWVQERIVRAAMASGLGRTIDGLPEGYDTRLGTYFALGRELSVGEWQMVAIARAWMRDSSLVIFDEPTASLDPSLECELLSRLRSLTQHRTAVIISHRLSMAVDADGIIVLDRGRVVEEGPHRRLVCARGVYATLFAAQASPYRKGTT